MEAVWDSNPPPHPHHLERDDWLIEVLVCSTAARCEARAVFWWVSIRSPHRFPEYRWGLTENKPRGLLSALYSFSFLKGGISSFTSLKEERGRERREDFFPATSLSALFVISVKKNGKWSRKRSTLALINPRPVSSLDAMLEIWTGLQLLTTSLASIQEPCSTSFFSSHREDEVGNASRPLSQLRPAANRGYECGLLAGLDSFFVFLLFFFVCFLQVRSSRDSQ